MVNSRKIDFVVDVMNGWTRAQLLQFSKVVAGYNLIHATEEEIETEFQAVANHTHNKSIVKLMKQCDELTNLIEKSQELVNKSRKSNSETNLIWLGSAKRI